MPKLYVMLLMFVLSSLSLCAQQKNVGDEFTIGKYTFQVIKNPDATFGFSVFKDGALVLTQKNKPYSTMPHGFTDKDNIRKIASWIISRIEGNKKEDLFMPYAEVVKLGISKNDL